MQKTLQQQQEELSPEIARRSPASMEDREQQHEQPAAVAAAVAAATTNVSAPLPTLLQQQQGTVAAAAPATGLDSTLTGALIVLGALLVSIPLSIGMMGLVSALLSHPLPMPVSGALIHQGVNFLLGALTTVATGYLVGRLAPKNGVRGLITGRVVGFVLQTLYVLVYFFLHVGSSGPYATMRTAYLMNLPMALFMYAGVTLAEVLIARWAAGRTTPPSAPRVKLSPSPSVSSLDRSSATAGDSR